MPGEIPFGEWLKRKRKSLGFTQEQLAQKINCSAILLRKIESGERRPSEQLVDLFAEVFNIPSGERRNFLKFARNIEQSVSSESIEDQLWRPVVKSPRLYLPIPITSLIGRENEVATVHEYLMDSNIRLVTLVGPPGIGKTRLSLEASRASLNNFPDGLFFIALTPLQDPSLIIPAIIQSLGYVEAKEQSLIEYLADGIKDKQMLLVMDNCEHLIEELAPLASRLLSACPHLKILATSRESLRIPGEWLYSVPALEIPKEDLSVDLKLASQFPALTLFSERAKAVRSDFQLNAANIQAVIAICKQLDGLPLAIELIATRIRLMSPQALLQRLKDDFLLSADGVRAVSVRQKTLSNAIGWSYDSLSAEEKSLFACLSVFSGSFSLEAAEKIFAKKAANKSATDLVTSLSDKSLLQRTVDAAGETRFAMLVTIQKFAFDRLRQLDGEIEARNSHLAYFLDLAKRADKESHGPNQLVWMDRLTFELDNFRVALNWSISSVQTEICLQLFNALGWTWNVRWSRSEEHSWFEKIRAMKDVVEYPVDYAQMLNNAGLREWRLGNYREARSILEESLAVWLKLGIGNDNDLGKAEALNRLGMVARWGESDINKAESYFNQSLALFQREEDDWGVAWNLFHLGGVASDRDQDQAALSLLEQSLSLYKELGDPWGMGRVTQFLGMLYLKLGNYKKAHFYFDQHLKNDESLRFMDGVSVALSNFGSLYCQQGNYDQAEQYYLKSLTISREYGMKPDTGVNLYNLGLLALHQNDFPKAFLYFLDYFESARTTNEEMVAHKLFIGLAAVAGGTNQPERAAKLLGAAQAIFDTTDNLFSSFDRAELDRHIQIAQGQLGKDVFEKLVNEGRNMEVDQSIAYAIG